MNVYIHKTFYYVKKFYFDKKKARIYCYCSEGESNVMRRSCVVIVAWNNSLRA